MKLLSKEEESQSKGDVNREDQEKIGQFSILVQEVDSLNEVKKQQETNLEALEDAALESELVDGPISYRIGNSFFQLEEEEISEKLEKEKETLEEKILKSDAAISEKNAKLSELKAELYVKFGSSINLER